jgi:uncharacterized membrane protein YkvA (DUF1232 family)
MKTTDTYADELNRRAENVNSEDFDTVLNNKDSILHKALIGPLARFFEDIKLLVALVGDYINGGYRELPWSTIAAVTASLVYVFSPIDLVPDFIPVAGLADDAAVVALCLTAVDDDLQHYKRWREQQEQQTYRQV